MKNYGSLLIVIVLTLMLFVSGCNSEAKNIQTQNAQNVAGMSCAGDNCGVSSAQTTKTEVQKVEVIHFHGTSQCSSCIAVGALAEETIKTYYSAELMSGKVTFAHINAELPENYEIAKKYGVTGSSLWIGVYDTNGFHKEENVNVWYKIQDKSGYMTYLKSIIDKRLQDDFS